MPTSSVPSSPSRRKCCQVTARRVSSRSRDTDRRMTTVGAMHIGVAIFPTDQTIDPVELARESEARGFESLWFPEHSHIPTSRETPWGGREGAPPLPEFYWRTHDPFVALAACAAVTSTIKLATGICLVAQRDPIYTAKEVASLDRLSGGRFLFGVGYGWNKEEMAHHGTAYGERRAILRESVLAMKELWTHDEASFDGDHVRFSSSWAWPKPHQAGGPPVILGGDAGPRTAADIVEFCDGWMPIGGRVRGCKTSLVGESPRWWVAAALGEAPQCSA